MKKLLVAMAALSVAACASASNPGAMVAPVTEQTLISETSALHQNVVVGDVTGGQQTNPMWTSQVSSEDFAEALRQTFAAHAMLATDTGEYRLEAQLVELKQPLAGFNMTVTSRVSYTLFNVETDEIVFEEIIEEEYTAQMSDAFVGVERLRLANEGSIRENITSLINNLIGTMGDDMSGAPMDAPVQSNETGVN